MEQILVTIEEFVKKTGLPHTTVRQYFVPKNREQVDAAKKEHFPGYDVIIVRNDEERKVKLPSLMRRAANAALAVGRNVGQAAQGKLIRVPQQVQRQRIQVCNMCDHFKADTAECGKCGCKLHIKTYLAAETCPINKWGEFESPNNREVVRADRKRMAETYHGTRIVFPNDWPDYRVDCMKMFLREENNELILREFPNIAPSLETFRKKPNCGTCRRNVLEIINNPDNEEILSAMLEEGTI